MIIKPKYYGPQIPSTYAVNMTAAASGSNGITVADDDDIDFGTGDFFLHWEGSLPDWTPSGNVYLIIKEQTGVSELYMRITATTGVITTALITGGVTRFTKSSPSTGIIDGQAAKITAVIVRETASSDGSVSYYINGAPIGSPLAITAGSPVSASNSGGLQICGLVAGTRYASNTISCIVGNFAPTAAEVLDLCANGIPESWKWGSQTAIITGNNASFETVGNWTGVSAAVTGGYDSGDAGHSTCLRIISADGSADRAELVAAYSQRTAGKRYRVKFDYKTVSGTGAALHRFRLGEGNGAEFTFPVSATWVEGYSQIVTAADNTKPVRIYSSNTGGSAGNELLIDNLEVVLIGATLALLPSSIPTSGATAWDDSSGNTGGGTLPAAGATKVTIRK